MSIDANLFRQVLARFSTGVTIVTTRDAHAHDHGMTVSAFSSLSLEPPLILVCIARDATMAPVMEHSSAFVVNVLSESQEPLSRRFAGKKDDRFAGLRFTRSKGGLVILDDVLAWLECRVVERHDGGDHSIVIGAVEHAGARDGHPLLYFRGSYAHITRS